MTAEQKIFTLQPMTAKRSAPPVPQTSERPVVERPMKRSGSLTGLNSLKNGVDDLVKIVSDQREALDQCREQITMQNCLIEGYQSVLEEHSQLFDRIIDG